MFNMKLQSGAFLDSEISQNRKFLLKYFKTDLQVIFLKFYLHGGDVEKFTNTTGRKCSVRILYKFKRQIDKLVDLYEAAKADFDEESIETLTNITSGKIKKKDL